MVTVEEWLDVTVEAMKTGKKKKERQRTERGNPKGKRELILY